MRSNRSHEFDALWGNGRWGYQNVLALFRGSVPYPFNFLTDKKPKDVAKVKEILEHLQDGYPYEGKKRRFEDNSDNVYAYLLMIKTTFTFDDPKGEIARKLDYALERMNERTNYKDMIDPDRFGYVLQELKERDDEELEWQRQKEENHHAVYN